MKTTLFSMYAFFLFTYCATLAAGYWLGLRARQTNNPQLTKLKGPYLMFIVHCDNQDVRFKIDPGTVTDSEGNPVDAGDLDVSVQSSNGNSVEVIRDPESP